MSPDDQEEADYVKSWRCQYDGAKEARSACIVGWLVFSLTLVFLLTPADDWFARVGIWISLYLGGSTLALLGHYQSRMDTYYSALKGTRDEPPRDELSARRRR